jgi:hypothetical protein
LKRKKLRKNLLRLLRSKLLPKKSNKKKKLVLNLLPQKKLKKKLRKLIRKLLKSIRSKLKPRNQKSKLTNLTVFIIMTTKLKEREDLQMVMVMSTQSTTDSEKLMDKIMNR